MIKSLKFQKLKIKIFFKGMAMGAADVVPGVSGGTVAFILGIYHHLIHSISMIKPRILLDLFRFDFKKISNELNLSFLFPLTLGILSSIFLFSKIIHILLDDYPLVTWSIFFGLISGSIVFMLRKYPPRDVIDSFILIFGTIISFYIVGMIPKNTPDHLFFIFLCGILGSSAMILPGISGSFILLILGKYRFITGLVKDPFVSNNIFILSIFAAGVFVGLVSISKLLNYLFKKYEKKLCLFLIGFMTGSLRKVWPWKNIRNVFAENKILSIEENFFPDFTIVNLACFFIMALAIYFVIKLEMIGSTKDPK